MPKASMNEVNSIISGLEDGNSECINVYIVAIIRIRKNTRIPIKIVIFYI